MILAKLNASVLPSDVQAEMIQNLKKKLNEIEMDFEAYLFGSGARRELTEYSDLDVLIVVAKNELIKETQSRLSAISKKLMMPIDFVIVTQGDFEQRQTVGGICAEAVQEGQPLKIWKSRG